MMRFKGLIISVIKSVPWPVKLIGTLLIVGLCLTFRLLSYQDQLQTARSVTSLLRNEYLSTNAYAISKGLADLELVRVISCSILAPSGQDSTIYYNTSSNPGCFQWELLQNLFQTQIQVQAANGTPYRLIFQVPFRWSMLAAEILSYLLILISIGTFGQIWLRQKMNHDLKLKALELEKSMVMDMAKQVQHDVASPLGALRTIVKVMRNVDPEVREILERAVDRTADVFNQLKSHNQVYQQKIGSVRLTHCLGEIIKEKEAQWGQVLQISKLGLWSDDVFVFGNELEMKRLFSNLLNNAIEADQSDLKKINVEIEISNLTALVKVSDQGRGIPEEILSRIGEKGYSFGKENHVSAGSGLGVFHAKTTLKSWGGDLTLQSRYGDGTTVSAIFKLV